MMTRLFRISGRVQGVGYRHAMCRQAAALGVSGWVRNRTDGTVEALVQGNAADVEALVAWARTGPPAARVEDVSVTVPGAGETQRFSGFLPKPTL